MKIKTLFFACALSLSSFAVSAQDVTAAVEKFTQAQQLAQQKKFAEASPILAEALEMAEGLEGDGAMALAEDIKKLIPTISMFDGVTKLQAKDFEGGIAALETSLSQAKMYGNADVRRKAARYISTGYMAMGIESFNAKDFPVALSVFEKGYKEDPKNIKLALYTAKAYAETGNTDTALKLFGEVIAAGTENSRYEKDASDAKADIANYVLPKAAEFVSKGPIDSVQFYVSKVQAVDPTNAQASILLMQAANNLKKYDLVITEGEKALPSITDPKEVSTANLLLGVAYQNKGNDAKALAALKKVTAEPSAAQAKAIMADMAAAQ